MVMTGNRRHSKQVYAGSLGIGGDTPVSVQSMTSCPLEDVAATLNQIRRLEEAGAQLVRLAVRSEDHLGYLEDIRRQVKIPLCADIHFNYRIAIGAINAGVDKIRLNPGNIGSRYRVEEVTRAARERKIPIRIGVNGGSIDRKKYPRVTPEALLGSAIEHIRILEDLDYREIVISIKSSDILQTIQANRMLAEEVDYPIHVGLTEAGYGLNCIVQSSVGIGALLLDGIGDTIRVSMTGDPVEEIIIGRKILESTGHRKPLIHVISCPTCGRTDPDIDVLELAKAVDTELNRLFRHRLEQRGRTVTVAVMGCEVNGPGEASHADVGIAGGRGGKVLLFFFCEKIRKIDAASAVEAMAEQVKLLLEKKS